MIHDYYPYTRAELKAVASIKWPDCICQDYEAVDSDDWVGLHVQILVGGWK